MIVRLDHQRPISRPTVLDPSAVFAAKSLLAPLLVVMTLVLCLLAAHAPLRGSSLLLGALTFLAAAGLIELKGISPEPLSLRTLVDLWWNWLLLLALLLLAATLSGLKARFAIRPLLIWALLT